MNGKPFFSVIVPVYNKEPHIARSINSILQQTFDDFEVIVINDASTDNSLEEINKFKDARIRVLQRDEPGPGGYAARNLGIKEAKAEWIAFLDADDEWFPEHLEKMHELALSFPDIYIMSCGWLNKKSDKLNSDNYYKRYNKKGMHLISLKKYLTSSMRRCRPIWSSVACFKKSSPDSLKLFPEELEGKRGGDLHAWLKLICCHKKMAWSPHIGATYHRDSVNMVTKTSAPSLKLIGKAMFFNFKGNLDICEMKLLKNYYNNRLYEIVRANLGNHALNHNIYKNIHWDGNKFIIIKIIAASLFPMFLYRLLIGIKNYYNASAIKERQI